MKQLGETTKPIKQAGYLLPWDKENEQPCMIMIENVRFIPVFSDKDKLDAHIQFTNYGFKPTIKEITDTDDFLDSVQPFRVALDPRPTERNTTRFTELFLQSKRN